MNTRFKEAVLAEAIREKQEANTSLLREQLERRKNQTKLKRFIEHEDPLTAEDLDITMR